MSIKKFTISIFFILHVFILLGCSDETKEPIKIGVDVFPGWAHIFIAQEKGFFEKNGVDVEIVLNEDYLEVQKHFMNQEIDGAFMVYADAIYASDRGTNTKVVYISDHSIQGDVIAAKPEFESLHDLKGKTVGVEGINSFSHLFVLSVLEKNGMKEGDVFIENVGAQDIVTALENNEIVAGHTYGPGKSEAMKKGYAFLAYAGDVPGIITDTLAFNADVVKNRPDDVKAVIKSLFEAKEFQKANREESLQIMATALSDTPESIGAGIDAVRHLNLEENVYAMYEEVDEEGGEEWLLIESGERISDFFLERGQISSLPDLNEIIEAEFVNELLDEK